ncbi:hypothetical protein [Paenibacillus endoradicis]|uniref:hypothetical protein n=1 Tax=Paenibacillus endoradicis TaxID=2972487 RepID=UPI00215925E7|nr:hypothetical protein [Paenibacillus endoradicis]MCR8656922.1 hypothetical protein [Paenibacillus endoradicis]
MAQISKKLEILADVDQPIEEIKDCIIAISIMHGAKQLEILKEVEMWLGETIEQATPKISKDDSKADYNDNQAENEARKE